MKYVNPQGLPEPFFRAVANDPYDGGGSDFTPSSLATPPRVRALINKYWDKIEIDVATRIDAFFGQAVHSVAERAGREGVDLVEERHFFEVAVDGVTYSVSAQIDLYETDTKTLHDWKTCKAYALKASKPEWVAQMNIQRLALCLSIQEMAEHLNIIALVKDNAPVRVVSKPQPVWPAAETLDYVEGRIRAHKAAEFLLPFCTKEEAWNGRRCAQYCDAAPFCTQFAQTKKTGLWVTEESQLKETTDGLPENNESSEPEW